MSHIVDLLREIRPRPGKYIGAPYLTRLAFFLLGFDYGAGKFAHAKTDPFLADFRDWIHKRYGSTSDTWEGTIRSHCASEREAFDRFWELLDEYLQQRPEAAVTESEKNGANRGQAAEGRTISST